MRSNWGTGLARLATAILLVAGSSTQAAVVAPATSSATRPASSPDRAAALDLLLPVGKPDVRSSSVLIIDESNSSVLYSKKAEVAAPIASITKLMTALVVLEGNQPLDEMLQITPDDRDNEKGSGSRLTVGTKLSRGDLLHLALMSSENRAAHAVGRNYPGGLPAMVRAMNAKATALGMKHARFVDPTGLSSRNVASPADLSRLVIAASDNPIIREYSTHAHFAVPVGKRLLEFRNTNTLVLNRDWDITVQKTGYISEAGQCLVMQAIIKERPVVIILLNSFGKYTRVADARRIRKWMETRQLSASRAH